MEKKQKMITAKPVSAAQAAQHYASIKDAAGMQDAQSMAAGGKSLAFQIGDGELVATLSTDGQTLWVDAAAGEGGVLDTGFALAEQIAKQSGCSAVSFQTARAGMVKKARAAGYEVTGFILKKIL